MQTFLPQNALKSLAFLIISVCSFSLYAQVGIGTSNPDPSSVLHIESSNKGVLLPKVNLRNLIDQQTVKSPSEGLLVYNIKNDDANHLHKGFYIWDNEKWDKLENQSDIDELMDEIDQKFEKLDNGSGWVLTGNNFDNTSDANNKFLGTTTWHSLYLRVNDKQIAEFDPHGGIAIGFNTKADWAGIAIGDAATITADEAVAIGKNAKSGSRAISLGNGSKATSDESIGLGFNAISTGSKASAIDHSALASANQSVAIGQSALSSGNSSLAIGTNSQSTQNKSIAIGDGSKAIANESFALGSNAQSASDQGLAIGVGAQTTNQQNAFAIGVNAQASGNNSMAVGHSSNASGQYALSFGYNSTATQQNTTALGANAKANGQNSTAIGYGANAPQRNTIIIGNGESKIGIGTDNPSKKLEVHGDFRLADGSQGEGKVLMSDANGNTRWEDLNDSNANHEMVYADLVNNNTQKLSNSNNPFVIQFNFMSLSKNIQRSQNGIQVQKGGIFQVNVNLSLNIDDDDAEDVVYEFYLAKWSNKINGASVFVTIDSAVDENEKYSVTLNKMIKLEQWEQVAVFAKKVNSKGDASALSLINGSCSFGLKKIDEL